MTEASPSPTPHESSTKKAVTTVRRSATNAADATSSTAHDLVGKTIAGIEANPLAVLAGGVALGVLTGAFMPRSARETRLLAPVGKRLSDTARGAVEAARDTAKSEFETLGLTRNAARDQVGKLLGDLLKALATAATAALTATTAASSTAGTASTAKPLAKKAS